MGAREPREKLSTFTTKMDDKFSGFDKFENSSWTAIEVCNMISNLVCQDV